MQIVTQKISQEHDDILKIEISYLGNVIHGGVGSHNVNTTVLKLVEGQRQKMCIEVGFDILDVDECTLPRSSPMRSQCHPTSECVNTEGDYYCQCPR